MATNPYTAPTLSGYNASPPPNDGSQSSANQLDWDKHTDKIGDPLKNFAEAIDAAVLAAFGSLIITDDPAEETTLLAAEEFAGAVGAIPTLARRANQSGTAVTAEFAADVNAFSENLVVGMEEFG